MSDKKNETIPASVTDCNHLGNTVKMREALRQVSRVAVEMTRKTVTGEAEDRKTVDAWALRLCDIVSAALAAPPRNCDVGTPEEQAERFKEFCEDSQVDEDYCSMCSKCVLKNESNCTLAWAHMLYEKREVK